MNYHYRHYCHYHRRSLISWIILSLVQGLHISVNLSQDYVNHFGTNYNNPKGHWKLARDCTKGRDTATVCIPPKGNVLCMICNKVAGKMKMLPHSELLDAKFFQGNLTLAEKVYRGEMRIDIIKCRYDVYARGYTDVQIFYITRGKVEKSAYFLNSFYSFNEAVHFGYKYFLRRPYVSWD